jgi:hypothetical protein
MGATSFFIPDRYKKDIADSGKMIYKKALTFRSKKNFKIFTAKVKKITRKSH